MSRADPIDQRELDAVMARVNSGIQHTTAGGSGPSLVRQREPTADHPHVMSGDASGITSKPPAKRAHAAGTSATKSSKGKGRAMNPPSPAAGSSHHFHHIPDSYAVPLRGFAPSHPSEPNTIRSTATQANPVPATAPSWPHAEANGGDLGTILPGIPECVRNAPISSTDPDVVMPPVPAAPSQPSLATDASVLPSITQQQLTEALSLLLTQLLSNLQAHVLNVSNSPHAPAAALPQTGMFLHRVLYLYPCHLLAVDILLF
jgi:hypothetical protein